MGDPLPPCPYSKRHNVCAVLPENDDKPVLLFCSHCGMTLRLAMDLPAPLDDLSAADIQNLVKKGS